MLNKWFRAHLPKIFHRLIFLLIVLSTCPPITQAEDATPDNAASITQLTQLLDALQAAEKTIPRDSFETSAVLPNTELIPASLNNWVQENTWLIPYSGALRDAQGVLMDRVGNSLDRALLLQAMLRELGYDTRLAQSTLTEEQAKQVLTERRPLPANTLPTSNESPEQLEKLIKEFNLDAVQLAKAKAEAEKNQQQLKTTLTERVERQTAEILKLLGPLPTPQPDESYKALQDHWWVQYQEKDQWFDLDPTLSIELAKQIHPKPLKTYELTKLSQLPSELLHSVTIKVILECAKEEKFTEAILAQTPAILPSEVLGKPLSVNHIAVNLPNDFNAGDLEAFKKTLLKQDYWFPVITVADQQYFDQEYTPDCILNKAKPPQTGTTIDNKMGDVLGAFDSPENTPPSISANNAFITSMWLEYEIHTPNQPKQTIRRQLFDLIGAAQRAIGGAIKKPTEEQQLAWRLGLLGSTAILPTAAQLSDGYLNSLAMRQLLQLRGPILDFIQPIRSDTSNTANMPDLLPAQLYALASLRQKLTPLPQYATQSNLLSLHHYLQLNTNSELNYLQAFDIVSNELNGNHAIPFAERLRQGVIDTNLEALLLEQTCNAELAICKPSINTANAWRQSQSSNWQVVRKSSDMDALSFNADIKEQVQQTLNMGYWVVLPKQPLADQPLLTWWRVHPVTGLTLGMDERGWGASVTEYTSLLQAIVLSGACLGVTGAKFQKTSTRTYLSHTAGCTILGFASLGAWWIAAEGAAAGEIGMTVTAALNIAFLAREASK